MNLPLHSPFASRMVWSRPRLIFGCFCIILMAGCGGRPLVRACNQDPDTLRDLAERMRDAINNKKIYPAEAVAEHVEGNVAMSFDYVSGNKASNVKVEKSS